MNAIHQDEAIEQAILAQLTQYREDVRQFRENSKLQETWDIGYQMYKKKTLPYMKKEDWEANIALPYAYQFIETICPRIVNAIFGTYPLFDCTPEYPTK